MSSSAGAPAAVTPESYIGCVIGLISKSEIRYEGVLASLDANDSSITLRNVRSYGTEGRKKDGPQVQPGDTVYDYIVFRGKDIKDLQVKSSKVQTKPPLFNDPAIIQSDYGSASSTTSASIASGTSLQYAVPAASPVTSSFDAYSLYRTGTIPLSSASSSTSVNMKGTSIAAPPYWQGNIVAANDAPKSQQSYHPSLIPMHNQFHYPAPETSCPGLPISELQKSSCFRSTTSSQIASSTDFDTSANLQGNSSLLSAPPFPSSFPVMPSFASSNQRSYPTLDPVSSKSSEDLLSPFAPSLHSSLSLLRECSDSSTVSLPSNPALLVSSEPMLPSQKVGSKAQELESQFPVRLNIPSVPMPPQEALLSPPLSAQKSQQEVPDFGEEFDFEAMNEKFKKEEIWGALGKAVARNRTDYATEDYPVDNNLALEDGNRSSSTPVYDKDGFFDMLSYNSHGRGVRGGRSNFPGYRKRDVETFGDFGQRSAGRGYEGTNYRGSYDHGRGFEHNSGRNNGVRRGGYGAPQYF